MALKHDLDIIAANVIVGGHSLAHIYCDSNNRFQASLDIQGQMEVEEGEDFQGVLEATLERWKEIFLVAGEWQVEENEDTVDASLVADEVTIAFFKIVNGGFGDEYWSLQEVLFLNEQWTCEEPEVLSDHFDIIEGEKSAILESVKDDLTRMYDHVRKQALAS